MVVTLVGFGRPSRSPRVLGAGLVLMAAGLALSGCQEVESNLVENQPYALESIEGTDISRVKLADRIANNIGLETATVDENGTETIVPHAALIYNPDGDVFVYTRPERETYVRAPVKVSRVMGDQAVLSEGPPPGTAVVTLGAAELLATEYEILNQHP